jgi:phosphoglycolate phosphatase
LKKYKHIIWDWNGTLLDDARLCVEILNGVLCGHGKAATNYSRYREEFCIPVIDYYGKLGFDFTVESFDEVAKEYVDGYCLRQFECKLQDGALEVLNAIQSRRLTQSILSAYQQDMLENAVKFFGVIEYFEKIVGLNDIYANGKVENGKKLMKELGYNGKEVLFIGDTVHDFEVSKAIGSDCVLIDDGHQQRQTLELCGTTVLDSITDVVKML